MSWKDDLIDAFEEHRPENYYELPKDKQLEIFLKFEHEYLSGMIDQGEYLQEA